MRYIFFIFFLFAYGTMTAQLTGVELLDKAIAYHDPNSNWEDLKSTFYIQESRPDGSVDTVSILLNNQTSFFQYEQQKEVHKIYEVNAQDSCRLLLNGLENISDEDAKKHKITCKYAKLIRNYYTYLWGLPMKLKDPGTIIHEEVVEEAFQKQNCYRLKVTYENTVGSDIWYFYFSTKNYSLQGYKFHRDESKNDGEYITLEGSETYHSIKLPKTRKWYYNKNSKFLGTDSLLPAK